MSEYDQVLHEDETTVSLPDILRARKDKNSPEKPFI